MRTAAKKDGNHHDVVSEFIAFGFSVLDISQLKNCCDLFVAKNGVTIAVEIKDGELPPSKRRLTPGENKFRSEWKGDYAIVESLEHVRLLDANIKNWHKFTEDT